MRFSGSASFACLPSLGNFEVTYDNAHSPVGVPDFQPLLFWSWGPPPPDFVTWSLDCQTFFSLFYSGVGVLRRLTCQAFAVSPHSCVRHSSRVPFTASLRFTKCCFVSVYQSVSHTTKAILAGYCYIIVTFQHIILRFITIIRINAIHFSYIARTVVRLHYKAVFEL